MQRRFSSVEFRRAINRPATVQRLMNEAVRMKVYSRSYHAGEACDLLSVIAKSFLNDRFSSIDMLI